MRESLRGHLLIAPGHLADPNFSGSVVLMIQHDGDGAFGVVLNRPTSETIRSLWTKVHGEPCVSTQVVHAGGPVPGPLVALHADASLADGEVLPGLFVSMEASSIEGIVAKGNDPLRFYAGYSGWGGGQLEAELQTGSWLSVLAEVSDVFHDTQHDLWRAAFRRASGTDDRFPFAGPSDGDAPSLN